METFHYTHHNSLGSLGYSNIPQTKKKKYFKNCSLKGSFEESEIAIAYCLQISFQVNQLWLVSIWWNVIMINKGTLLVVHVFWWGIHYTCLCEVPVGFLCMCTDVFWKYLTTILNVHYEWISTHKFNQNTQWQQKTWRNQYYDTRQKFLQNLEILYNVSCNGSLIASEFTSKIQENQLLLVWK